MAATVTVTPNNARVGQPLTFEATDFDSATSITLAVTGPDASFVMHDVDTTDVDGAYTWTDEIEPSEAGVLAYSVTDGINTVSGRIQIYS